MCSISPKSYPLNTNGYLALSPTINIIEIIHVLKLIENISYVKHYVNPISRNKILEQFYLENNRVARLIGIRLSQDKYATMIRRLMFFLKKICM